MDYLKKIGKVSLFTFISIIILGLLLNTLYYFDIISNNVYNIAKMIIVLVILFINALLLGKSSDKYGLVEGLKLGGIFLLIMVILKITLNSSFDIRTLIYSIIVLLTTSVGAIIGINKKDAK
ncbi:MAG TPA: TIGR04086 family membrane protein [Candidatus Onthousia faecipullorum]|uniref:TIGR04086 family membrane protein n=1 Tax=Candidatus Onthousia faecipullorum TaxID=2840887 RepID=A0A9D1KC47_9FIRM|nr:TIGR04086 family membrane protein [Candidatus Onthousia faecipullorum]